jgi:hypothetical protein
VLPGRARPACRRPTWRAPCRRAGHGSRLGTIHALDTI